MKIEEDLAFWISEGNLFRAEQVYQKILLNTPRFKTTELAKKLQIDLIEHHQQLAGKAILSNNTPMLRTAITKLEYYGQDSIELKLALKNIVFKRKLWLAFVFITFVSVLYLMYFLLY
ncbi:MAG: hypothetical protein FJX90_09415 [Bacteroidetes bacterium]|nr:hypothetical protein [Bacteroidota bacterium]